MKNLIKNCLVVVVLFTTLLGNANSSFNISNDDRRTTLTLKDVKPGDELLIKDIYGVILYKEKIKNSGNYVKGFDLTELPNGDYFFELEKELKIKVIPFNVMSNKVSFKKEMEFTIYKASVRKKENKVYISKLSLKKQPVKIEVYYENSNHVDFGVIYSETIKDTQIVQRILELNKNEKGNYKIVTKTEGRTFINNIRF